MRIRLLLFHILFLIPWRMHASHGEQCAPLRDFFLPSYGENGEKIWDARGDDIEIGENGESWRITNFSVQLYDPVDLGKVRIILESADALLQSQKQYVVGQNFVNIAGSFFSAMGSHWTFFMQDQSIVLEQDVHVFWESDLRMTPILHSGRKEEIVPETFIVIDSDLLQISQSQEEFLFNFSQNVEVKGVDFRLTCDHLKMHGEGGIAMVAMEQKISHHHLRSIRALGHVFLEQDDCFASANLMELFPEEGVIIFSGDAKLRDEKGTLCAEKFILRNGERRILVENDGTERSRVTIDIN